MGGDLTPCQVYGLAFRPGPGGSHGPACSRHWFISESLREAGGRRGGGRGWRRMGGELVLHQETQRPSPRKLPCSEGKIEAGSILWFLKGGREKKISLQMCGPLSTGLFFPPRAEDTVPVSCHSTRGLVINRMSRCHWSLGRACSAPTWLLSRPHRPWCSLLNLDPTRPRPGESHRATAFPRNSRDGDAPASLSAGEPQPDGR